jgi:hypothetical protein
MYRSLFVQYQRPPNLGFLRIAQQLPNPPYARLARASPACRPRCWGLFILKHMRNLSEGAVRALAEEPYYEFCGELSICHRLPLDRSSLRH